MKSQGFLATLLVLSACTGDPASLPARSATPTYVASHLADGHYRLHLDPGSGRLDVSVGDRVANPLARAYDYGSQGAQAWTTCGTPDCLPGGGQIAIWTDQSLVSFVDSTSTCHGAGCATIASRPTCNVPGVFCAPLQLNSNQASPLNDVVMQMEPASTAQPNVVDACLDSGLGGRCSDSALTADRVDSADSALTSSIDGCSYCVGNAVAAQALGMPGLVYSVAPGLDQPQHGANRVMAAFTLDNEAAFAIDLTVHVATAALDTTNQVDAQGATCMVSGSTNLVVRGSGFGAPGECFPTSNGFCPATGSAPVGGRVVLTSGPNLGADLQIVSWSDEAIVVRAPVGMTDLGGVGVRVLNAWSAIESTEALLPSCSCSDVGAACGEATFGGTCNEVDGEGVCSCNGGTFSTQAQLDSMAACATISGPVVIDGSITDLSAFANVHEIDGALTIQNTNLTNLEGLENLTTVTDLIIDDNDDLTSLRGLGITGGIVDLYVRDNAQLTDLLGLGGITDVTGHLELDRNPLVTSTFPLSVPRAVLQTLIITGMSSLADVHDLGIAGTDYVFITENALTTLDGIDLSGVIDHLEINHNPDLVNLDGLENVTGVNDYMDISFNAALTDINGLSNIGGYCDYVVISENPSLSSLAGLSLPSFGGLALVDLPAITSLAGLAASSIGALNIKSCGSLTSLSGLEGTTSYFSINIENNASLTSIAALGSVSSTSRLSIVDNVSLDTLGLGSLSSVSTLTVTGNDSLCSSTVNALDAQVAPASCSPTTCTGNDDGC
jgi:hypothetical protein